MLRFAFKEWAAVCEALAIGRQTIILRKGGIAEEGGQFRPEHDRFWLYPTYFHEQQQKGLKAEGQPLHEAAMRARTPVGKLRLSNYCEVCEVWYVDRLDAALALNPFHIWTEEAVRQRFHYRTPRLFVLAVQVWCLNTPIDVSEHTDFAGCKTWVELKEEVPIGHRVTALSELELEHEFEKIRKSLGQET